MLYLESIILNLILISFPLMVYLLYIAYNRKIKNDNANFYLEIALYTSTYLIMRYASFNVVKVPVILLLNVPLLISYLKNKNLTSIIISTIIGTYYILELGYNPYLVFFEYAIYYSIYVFIARKKLNIGNLINSFVLIKAFIISIQVFYLIKPFNNFIYNFTYIFINVLILYSASYLVLYFLKKAIEMIDLNKTLIELEKEKSLRSSLFKLTHEIKNPLAVCKGYLDMINTSDIEKVEKYIPIIKEEINRTLTLMDDYLDYTKIKIEKEFIDIYYLLEDTLDSMNGLFKKNNVITDFKVPRQELYINADYNRLKQVLVNIFKNAIEAKSIDRDLKLSLRTKLEEKNLKIIIDDNGVGMDRETLSRISEMFFTTKKNGTGLGVSLSYEIVNLHHGRIKYYSELDKGTKVIITLPIKN